MKVVVRTFLFTLGLVTLFSLSCFADAQGPSTPLLAQMSCSIRVAGKRAVKTADVPKGHGQAVQVPLSVEFQGYKCDAQAASQMGVDLPGLIVNMTFTGPKQGQTATMKLEKQYSLQSETLLLDDVSLAGFRAYCSCGIY